MAMDQAGASSSNTPQVAKLERPEKNSKRITEWIKSINDLHKSKPSSTAHLQHPMPDIETLMQQWPPSVEQQLQSIKLPDATLDVDLDTFVRIVCGMLDIPVYDNPIESLHALFTLFVEFKNNPAFKSSLNMSDQRAPSQQSSRSQQHGFVGGVNQTVSGSSRQNGEILSFA